MKKFIACLAIFLFSPSILAQQSCSPLEKQITIVFGNGILTSFKSASDSRDKLRDALGDDFNGIRLGYETAYNESSGAALDLLQSLWQADLQWNSQVAGWLNNLGVIPDWFEQWRQRAELGMTLVVAPELQEHVLMYHDELVMGHGVLVVSHSQGNFYANEAKPLLQIISTDAQMAAFTIFGVATPANNVGGAGGPYYTNHRDFIQHMLPDTLPNNWQLHYAAAGHALADDVSIVKAHFFNDIYMSKEFDIREELLRGFRASMAALRLPEQQACANYRQVISNQVQGVFVGQLFGSQDTASFTFKDGVISLPDGNVSFTHPEDSVALGSDSKGIGFTGENGGRGSDFKLNSAWDPSGQFARLSVPFSWWETTAKVPATALAHSIDVVAVATDEMKGYRGVFPPGTCKMYPDMKSGPQNYTVNDQYLPISVDGAAVIVGGQTYSLISNMKKASLSVIPIFIADVLDPDSQFWLDAPLTTMAVS
jgi:hypothetical protein